VGPAAHFPALRMVLVALGAWITGPAPQTKPVFEAGDRNKEIVSANIVP